jgi:alkylhydroperoxidase/carboxymuconolactone decarboxylase family protein YurZ
MRQEAQMMDLTSLAALFSSPAAMRGIQEVSPSAFKVASEFWRVPLESRHLTPRMKELALFAMHASATALNMEAIKRHIERALAAGATKQDIVDVLIAIVGLANHALYASVPVLEQEWQAAGRPAPAVNALDPELEAAKKKFTEIRGFWNSDRDPIARQMPEYFRALTELSIESWQHGSLTRKEREFICIAIDCTVTHTYPPGLRIHIRNAIDLGATREEILEIFQLAALLGLEGYVMAAEAMFGGSRA